MAKSQVKSREAKAVDFDEHSFGVIAQRPAPRPGPSDEKLEFDDSTLKAAANMYSNRAKAYYQLGNFHEALNDVTAAVKLEPTLMEAIETGAKTCEQLQCYEDAVSWCEKGLEIDKTNKMLLDLRSRCAGGGHKLQKAKGNSKNHSVKGQHLLDSEIRDQSLGDSKKVIENHELDVKIAKDVEERDAEEESSGNLGNIKSAIEYHESLLKNAKEVGDRASEGKLCGILGNAHHILGNFKKAIEYYKRHLKIAEEVGDRTGEGKSYGYLGNAYDSLGDFKTAIKCHERRLEITKEVKDRVGVGESYGDLGIAYRNLGDFETAIKYHEMDLKIAKAVGDKAREGVSYGNLGNAYDSLGDFKKAIEYHEFHLKIAKEVGSRAGEGTSYGNLGNAYDSLGDFKKAIQYHELGLKFAKEMGDKAAEGASYGNLGNAYDSLGDFKKAIEYQKRHLKIAKEMGDRAGEGKAYANLGNAYDSLGEFEKAIEYHELDLAIAKEVGDKAGEGASYANLGNAYQSLGDFKKAIEYHKLDLRIAKEVRDRAGEGKSYANLGNAYDSLGEFEKAIEYHELDLEIAKEVGDRAGEGASYANLGNAYQSLGDFKKAIEYHELDLEIAKEVEDRAGEGTSYANLGNAYHSQGDFKKAIEYYELDLEIAKEVGDRAGEGASYCNLGICFESQDCVKEALDCYHSSVRLFNDVRQRLQVKDEWTISYRDDNETPYSRLWRLLLKQGDVKEALFAVEEGRAQALRDLMHSKYETKTPYTEEKMTSDTLCCLSSNTVFMAVHNKEIIFWIIQNGTDVQLRRKEIIDSNSKAVATTVLKSLIEKTREEVGVRGGVRCEDRSLDRKSDGDLSKKRDPTTTQGSYFDTNALRTWYDFVISPIKDLINGNELTFVPEGPLCLAPYAAFMDSNSKYLSESFRIRVIPSLISFKLIKDCSSDNHQTSRALLVGDPCLEKVIFRGRKLDQLPCAKKEVEMIKDLLKSTAALTGKKATKHEVLKMLPSVDVVHIAAHGSMDTGEIVLAPNTTRASNTPVEEDFLLTMGDVMRVKMRARLVVLSCCHSGRGEIKAEGVVGIARAFLGAGVRAVLVSLWAIDDEATLKFMKSFYLHLTKGRRASESLDRAMKCLRESEEFSEVMFWAPFILIGDDVTLNLAKGD